MRPRGVCLFVAWCTACGVHEGKLGPPVPAGAVAVVGQDVIAAATVQRVATSQTLVARAALSRAVSDALLAAKARAGLHPAEVRTAERRALARALLEDIQVRARAAGAPTDVEVATETERRWWALDRPRLVRVTHAVVLTNDKTDDARARAVAKRLSEAVAPASESGAFRSLASTVKDPAFEIRVEDLAPVAPDGRVVDPAEPPPVGSQVGSYDADFAAAAHHVPGAGKQSGIIKSPFGYHVILVTEILPPYQMPIEERRKLLEPDVLQSRATKSREDALEHARSIDHTDIERAAGELTEKVNVSL